MRSILAPVLALYFALITLAGLRVSATPSSAPAAEPTSVDHRMAIVSGPPKDPCTANNISGAALYGVHGTAADTRAFGKNGPYEGVICLRDGLRWLIDYIGPVLVTDGWYDDHGGWAVGPARDDRKWADLLQLKDRKWTDVSDEAQISGDLRSVSGFSGGWVWAVGTAGVFYLDATRTGSLSKQWVRIRPAKRYNDYYDVYADSARSAYVTEFNYITSKGAVLHCGASGCVSQLQTEPYGRQLFGIAGTSRNDVWTNEGGGTVFYLSSDGTGHTWYQAPTIPPGVGGASNVWPSKPPGRVYFVGGPNGVESLARRPNPHVVSTLKTVDAKGATGYSLDLWSIGDDTLWVTGLGGNIWKCSIAKSKCEIDNK